MMRLLDWPVGLAITSVEVLSGPRAVGASGSESIGGFAQTTASPFGVWRFRLSFQTMRGQLARRHRGFIAGLHGGANAFRFTFCDLDKMTPAEAGVTGAFTGQPWDSGAPWSNGQKWRPSYPAVAVSEPAAKGATTVRLASEFWGHDLGAGDFIGFFPFHLALYQVTQVLGDGEYRIWPPLRAALTTDGDARYCTLSPTLVMRPEGEAAATVGRGLVAAEGLTGTFIEVQDDIVREYF